MSKKTAQHIDVKEAQRPDTKEVMETESQELRLKKGQLRLHCLCGAPCSKD